MDNATQTYELIVRRMSEDLARFQVSLPALGTPPMVHLHVAGNWLLLLWCCLLLQLLWSNNIGYTAEGAGDRVGNCAPWLCCLPGSACVRHSPGVEAAAP